MASQTDDTAPVLDSFSQDDVPEKSSTHAPNPELHHDNNSNHHEPPVKPTGTFSDPSRVAFLLAHVLNKRSPGCLLKYPSPFFSPQSDASLGTAPVGASETKCIASSKSISRVWLKDNRSLVLRM
jgi:hypothetical protein